MADLKKFVSGENLVKYDEIIKSYIGTEDAKSIKSITVSGNTVSFFKTEDASGTAAYTVNIPDVSGFMSKIASANGGKIVTSLATGEVSESNTAIADLATNAFVGAIPAGATATTVTGYVDEAVGEVASDLSTLDNSLAAVAKSGAASDVSYANTTSGLQATTAQAAIDEVVAGLGTAAAADVATTAIQEESTDDGLVSAEQVAAFVAAEIAGLEGAMHFVGVIKRQTGETDAQAIARVVTDPESGDVVVMSDNAKEYVYDGTAWREVGDETEFVKKTTTIAGVDLQDNITDSELRTALNVADGAQVNVLEGVKVNGTDLTIDANKKVNVTVAEGATNGTVAVNGADVAVHGLGTAAYTASTAYDASGAAAAVLGESTDTSSANTVYGAKKYTDDAYNAITSYTDAEIEKLFA